MKRPFPASVGISNWFSKNVDNRQTSLYKILIGHVKRYYWRNSEKNMGPSDFRSWTFFYQNCFKNLQQDKVTTKNMFFCLYYELFLRKRCFSFKNFLKKIKSGVYIIRNLFFILKKGQYENGKNGEVFLGRTVSL
jgi:hypothetical protein